MLVRGADDVVIEQGAVARVFPGGVFVHGFGFHALDRFDAGGAGVDADGAVLLEDPVEDVVVVAHGADPAHHQFTTLGAEVGLAHFLVFVFGPGVALEHRHGTGDRGRCAGVVGDGGVQQHGVLRGVLAAGDRRGQGAHAVVAGVEVGLEVPADVRVAVRHDHAAQRAFVHDLAFLALVVVGDGGQDRPDPRIEANVEVPVLPVNAVAADGVVLALGLDDFQRLDCDTLASAPVIRRRFHRHRNERVVFDLDQLLLFQVDNRHQAFNRVRPVVAVTGVEVADDFQQALVLRQAVLAVEETDSQRRGHNLFHIVDAALGQGLGVFRAGFHSRLHRCEIVQQHHAVGAFDRLPGLEFFRVEVDQGFDHVLAVEHHD
ncbi:hypothetical protein D9M71_292240 [compost metagenome]